MELLSPAGNLSSAYAAFKGGADAIYLGGKQFSARASAENFTNDEIKEITFFAHSIGRRVYVTLNTLLFQDEFMQAVEFAKFLYSINVDGIIIQDLGLAHYLHQILPNIPLNASTQLNCHNLEEAKALMQIGFKRIVLARETPLSIVKEIKELGVEVEVFGHGALCVSYSGNCLLSSFIGERSGNRGRCAQPCRMPYDLYEDAKEIEHSSFLISTKDLKTLDYVNELIDLGVDSLKIEGRLKSDEYIYYVSKSYRHAIDAAIQNKINIFNKEDTDKLTSLYNRKFTKGFLFDESPFELINRKTSSHQGEVVGKVIKVNKNRVSILLKQTLTRLDGIRFNGKEQIGLTVERMFLKGEPVEVAYKNQVIDISGVEHADRLKDLEVIKTKSIELVKEIENDLRKCIRIPIKGKLVAYVNQHISLTLFYQNHEVTSEGYLCEKAVNLGTSKERIVEQLSKSGDYPYYIDELSVEKDECFIPISALNDLRNRAFEKLKNELIVLNNIDEKNYKNPICPKQNSGEIYFLSEDIEVGKLIRKEDFTCYSPGGKKYTLLNRINSSFSSFAQNNIISQIIKKTSNIKLISSMYCSITNSYALDCYFMMGFDQCILSLELDYDSTKKMIEDFYDRHSYFPNVAYLVYGKADMMVMRSCPIGGYFHNRSLHCERCHSHRYELVDKFKEKYHMFGDENCIVRILDSKPIYCLDLIKELSGIGINNFVVSFTDEKIEEVNEIIQEIKADNYSYQKNNHKRGHYFSKPL